MTALADILALALREHQAGNLNRAEQLYCQILQADPGYADALHLQGVLVSQRGQHDLAISYMEQALTVKPGVATYHNNLGFSYQALRRWDEAEAHFRQAIHLQADFAMAHNNLGNVHRAQGKSEDAAECYRQATRIQPDYAEAHGNLGAVLQEQGKLHEALPCYEKALRLQPTFPDAHNNLATALLGQGCLDEAMTHYDQAVLLRPNYVEAHWNRSCLRLLRGDFEGGWPEYEWRSRQAHVAQRSFRQPLWDGSELNNRTIFLYAEQGFGDTLQFIRYACLVKRRGGIVIVECQPALARLLANIPGIDHLVAEGSPLPVFDVQAPLLSLPGIFHTTLDTIPARVPYVYPNAELVKCWKSRKSEVGSRKSNPLLRTSDFGLPTSDFLVGIAWQGRPTYGFDRLRSIPLAQLARLAEVPGVRLISLQKGPGAVDLRALAGRFPVLDLGSRLDEASGAFMDTAAVMRNVDLVIASDTAVPHLAGALGVPVWVTLPAVPDWRWLLQREDSPWYPTMRLFRQTRSGSWEDVVNRIADELKAVVSC